MTELIVPTPASISTTEITHVPGQERFAVAMLPAVREIARILATVGTLDPNALQQALLGIVTGRYQQAYLRNEGDSEEAHFYTGGDVHALYLMLERWLNTLVPPPPAGV